MLVLVLFWGWLVLVELFVRAAVDLFNKILQLIIHSS